MHRNYILKCKEIAWIGITVRFAEIPYILDSPELFLILVVYYGITNDTRKIMERN